MGYKYINWMEVAQNRIEGKAFVLTMMNLQFP